MKNGLESGYMVGGLSGLQSGLGGGLQSSNVMTNRLNSINPNNIKEPKVKPVFYINGDNVALLSGAVQYAYNMMDSTPGEILPKVENIFQQVAGTTYRPPLVVGGLNGKNYINFADTGNRYLESGVAALYAQTAPAATGTGLTYMFIIKRANRSSTVSILDGRDSTTLPTPNDLLLEINAAGRITFDYKGGVSGTVTSLTGTAGVDLLNDWSILTVKCQLREDGGNIPSDSDGADNKRYANPSGAKIGPTAVIDIFVNGAEQDKTITTNTYTNADYFGDGSYRMLDRDIFIGNKGSVYGTSGTHIAAVVMWPCYIDKAIQQRVENYFRWYYSLPF
jgi:hypothetical protein